MEKPAAITIYYLQSNTPWTKCLLWKSASKRMGNQPYSSWGKQQTGWGDQPQQNTWSQHINNQAGKPTSTI